MRQGRKSSPFQFRRNRRVCENLLSILPVAPFIEIFDQVGLSCDGVGFFKPLEIIFGLHSFIPFGSSGVPNRSRVKIPSPITGRGFGAFR